MITNPVQKVIDIVGSQKELARLCAVKQQSVFVWLKSGKIPPRRVLTVEKIVNGKISRHELNPDIYPKKE